MRRIRGMVGQRNKLNPQGLIFPTEFKRNKNKRQRWDAILSRLPNNVKLIGAEIGVLNGNTSFRILGARKLLTLYMIDPWIAPVKGSSYFISGDDNARKPAQAHEAAYRKTLRRVDFAGSRAKIMRMFSHEAAPEIKNGSLDFVFIDGDHSYEGNSKDIKLWLPKVKKGGFISGHDYNHPRLPGVKKAVDEAFSKNRIELDDNRTWFVRL